MNSSRAREYFHSCYGTEPLFLGSAPGRVNLIGEHTDYNGGQVLPIAIDQRTFVALSPAKGANRSRLASAHEKSPVEFDMAGIERTGKWADYMTGVCAAFASGGAALPQIDAAVVSDVPTGSGLSSSAALELATSIALSALIGETRSLKELALLSWRVENDFVGVASGVMDQFASALCQSGAALHLWCDTLETEHVPVKEALLIFDTSVPRSLRSSQFNQRRAECDEALALLKAGNPGLANLASASPDEVIAAHMPITLEKRALHVTEETRRVEQVVAALRGSGRLPGEILYASHDSLRTKYDCSSPELDWFVDRAHTIAGVTGARLTGAGWGGCAIAVGEFDALAGAADSVCKDYEKIFRLKPRTWITRAAQGANLEQLPSRAN